MKCVECCFNFGQVIKDLERSLIFGEETIMSQLSIIDRKVKEILTVFRKQLCLILRLLHDYQQKGIKFQCNFP